MQRKRTVILLVTALLAMVAMTGAALAAETYKLGYITDLSGALRDAYTPVMEGFKLYVKALNDRGGINGHPVEILVRNDQLDATRATSLAIELITAEKVNSIWGLSLTRTHKAVYETVKRYKVPAVSCFSGTKDVLPPEPLQYSYSVGHVFEIGGEASGKVAAEMMKGKGKMVVNSIEAPGGFAACDFTEGAAQAGGLTTGQILFAPTETEFGATVAKVIGMGPDVVVIHNPPASAIAMLRTLRAQGYKGPIIEAALGHDEMTYAEAIESTGYTDNTYLMSRWSLADSEGKELDELRAAVKKHGIPGNLCVGNIAGWTMGVLAEAALKKCGWPCSGEQLNVALENINVSTGALMGGPIAFTPTDHYGKTWWRVFKYDGASKKFKPVTEWKENASTPTLKKK